MATISIGSSNYSTYRTLAQTDAYLGADFAATEYRGASADDRSRAIVTGTRTLDRLQWAGDKADSDQTNAWPRINTGVTGVEDDEVPLDILNAESELAKFLSAGVDVLTPDEDPKVKRQAAGSVSIEYFKNLEDPTRLPSSVLELISKYFGETSTALALSFGTDACSHERSYRTNGGL